MIPTTLEESLQEEFTAEVGFKYATSLEKAELYEIRIDQIREHLQSDHSADAVYFRWLYDLAFLHFEYSIYLLYKMKNRQESNKHLGKFLGYGEVILDAGSHACNCLRSEAPYIVSNKATFMASTLLLTGEMEDFLKTCEHLINSLNGKNCIIKKGYKKATISWFLLKLFSFYIKKEITLHKLLQPILDDKYELILEKWDTTDNKEVLFAIEALCELHLTQATLDLADVDKYTEEDTNSLRYIELFLPAMYTFPYEILVWLKLREKTGLKNPKTFAHPLMNTPIAKMFLDIKEPLPKPTELPYAKELLEKLKERCPNIKIPTWLESSEEANKEKRNYIEIKTQQNKTEKHFGKEIIKSNEVVQKSGIYQAFLPPEHPLAKQVHQMPESKRLGVAGVTMYPLGLDPKDEEQLRWEWVGE
jgi:hypothetical protein